MIFSKSTDIRKRILEAVEAKIAKRQEALDTEIKELEEKLERDKVTATENAVNEILSKFDL